MLLLTYFVRSIYVTQKVESSSGYILQTLEFLLLETRRKGSLHAFSKVFMERSFQLS